MIMTRDEEALDEMRAHQEIRSRFGSDLDHYAEIIADAFGTALEDGYTHTEIRLAVFEKLKEWGIEQ